MKPVLKGEVIAVDLETTGLEMWHGDRPFAFPMCNEHGDTWYLEVPVDPDTRIPKLERKHRNWIKSVVSNPKQQKVFHNAKFDVRHLEMIDIHIQGPIHETTFLAHCCNPLEFTFALKPLSRKYLGIDEEDQDTLKEWVKHLRRQYKNVEGVTLGPAAESDYWLPKYDDPSNELCEEYAVTDAERTMMLFLMYMETIEKIGARSTYELEMELWPVVYQMEGRGIRADISVIKKERHRHLHTREETLQALRDKIGKQSFNPRSVKQLQWMLYEKMGLPVTHKSGKKGKLDDPLSWEEFQEQYPGANASTNWQVLSANSSHEEISILLRYRSSEKARTFYDNYLNMVVEDDIDPGLHRWALKPNFVQMGPATGRFACRNPNLQNVAYGMTARSRGVVPFSARTPFGPREEYIWLFGDYKQLEARLFADQAKEPFMLQAFLEGRDFHTECCNKAWGGKDNDGGLRAIGFSLVLDRRGVPPREVKGEYGNDSVLDVWKRYEFKGLEEVTKLRRGHALSERAVRDADRVADLYLQEFDYDIVEAEKNIGYEVSRNRAKSLLFCRIFGGGARAAMDLIQCSFEDAQKFMKDYSVEFPRIDEFISEQMAYGREHGYVRNAAGRRLTVDKGFEYRAVNYIIQSLAADMLKRSMVRCHNWFRENGLDAHVLITIHDELVFEIHKNEFERWLVDNIERLMMDHADWVQVPTPVDFDMATKTWDEKEHLTI